MRGDLKDETQSAKKSAKSIPGSGQSKGEYLEAGKDFPPGGTEEKMERIVACVIGTQAEDRSQRTSHAIRGWNFILSLPVCKRGII